MSDAVDRAAEVLIAHTRTTIVRCHCGWADLGKSHAEHVARALADAGLLSTAEHDAAVAAKALREAATDAAYGIDWDDVPESVESWLRDRASRPKGDNDE